LQPYHPSHHPHRLKRMKREHKIALALGIPTAGLLAFYLIAKAKMPWQKYLYISAGEGGTTDPPPGTYKLNVNEEVTITAIPDSGYTVGKWSVDGVDWGHVDSITITMDTDHIVIVTFWKGGVPPPTEPALIKSLGMPVVKTPIGGWVTGTACVDQHVKVSELTPAEPPKIQFQVVDAAGKGVPGVDVALWTDPMPDPSRYKGILTLDGAYRPLEKPLVKKTDSNGIVSAELHYHYGLDDNYKQICSDANLGITVITCTPIPIPYSTTVSNCYTLGALIALQSKWGGCETGASGCEKMGTWQFNRIYAQVVGIAKLSTVEFAQCGFAVFWTGRPA